MKEKKREARKKNLNVDDVVSFKGFFPFRIFPSDSVEHCEQDCLAENFGAHVEVSNGKTQVELTVGGGQFGDCRCVANLKRASVSVSFWASSGHVLSDPVKCRTYFRFRVTYLVHKPPPNVSGDSDW